MVDSTSAEPQAERNSLALCSELRGRENAIDRGAQGSRKQDGSVGEEQGTIRQDSMAQASCGALGTGSGAGWGEGEKDG